jgi:hypothetical protein
MSDINPCQYGHTPNFRPTLHGQRGYCKVCLEFDFVAETVSVSLSRGVVVEPTHWTPSSALEIEARKKLAGLLPVAAVEPQAVPNKPPKVANVRQKEGAGINARMLAKIQVDTEAMYWSINQWVDYLGCSKSTVAGTDTWKKVCLPARERERLARGKRHRKPRRHKFRTDDA